MGSRDAKSLDGVKLEDRENTCPDCGSKEIEYKKGELYCKKCGLVLE